MSLWDHYTHRPFEASTARRHFYRKRRDEMIDAYKEEVRIAQETRADSAQFNAMMRKLRWSNQWDRAPHQELSDAQAAICAVLFVMILVVIF